MGQLRMETENNVFFDVDIPAGRPYGDRYRALYLLKAVSFQDIEGPWEDSIDGC